MAAFSFMGAALLFLSERRRSTHLITIHMYVIGLEIALNWLHK
jgi:hypothetical protein